MHILKKYLCRILFCQLRRIGKIRSFLSTDAANKLAVSLFLCFWTHCLELPTTIPQKKTQCFTTMKKKLKTHLFEIHLF